MPIFPSSILSSHSAEQSHKRDLKFYRELEKTGSGALWAKIAQNVKKPPLTVNVIDFDFFGFNVSILVPWIHLGSKK